MSYISGSAYLAHKADRYRRFAAEQGNHPLREPRRATSRTEASLAADAEAIGRDILELDYTDQCIVMSIIRTLQFGGEPDPEEKACRYAQVQADDADFRAKLGSGVVRLVAAAD